jgi:site-specific recombinase XerD
MDFVNVRFFKALFSSHAGLDFIIQKKMEQVAGTGRSPTPWPKLLQRLREAIRTPHYSRRTEKAYCYWVRYFIRFHNRRHPAEIGSDEVTAFLSWLATDRDVAAATRNQALSAILFLYKHVLERDLPWMSAVIRARRPSIGQASPCGS